MFTTTLLASVALAHTQLFVPAPKFLSPAENNYPSFCNEITFHNDAPAVNIDAFTSQLKSKFGGSLLAYFKACGSDSPKTDHNGQAPIPADGMVKIDSHSQHPGLYEFYIDDTKVADGTWQVGQTPDTLPIDFSKCAGTCKFRYMMAAVHQQPIQLYDNIVTLTGGKGAGNPNPSTTPTTNDEKHSGGNVPGSYPYATDTTSTSTATATSSYLPTPVLGNVAEWGQCGGLEYSGPTNCDSGLVCKMLNPYYYQCLADGGYKAYRRR